MTQVLTKRTVEGRDMVNIDDVFSLLDFAFVPLKPKTNNLMERLRDQLVRWNLFHTFDRQHRPLTLAVLQQKDCEPDLHWEHIGKYPSVTNMR